MAIDKLNFSGINSGSDNFVSPVGSLADRLMKYGNYMVTQGNEDERLKLQQEKDAYQRGRDAITDARLNKQEARQDKEQAANDLFYTEFAKGQQNKGGLYGDLITKESDKYAFTDGEIGLATQYKNDPLLARAAGQNALADKIDWQLKAGDKANAFVDSNVDDESQVERYDRIGSLISSKGYTPPKELIIAADQARLAERTAEEAKSKLLDDQRAEILKNQTSDAKFLVNSYGNNGASTVYDVDGNEVQVNKGTASTINREYNKDIKNVGDASKIIRESVTALEGIEPEDKASALSQANRAVDILVKRGVPIDVAAETVTGELTSGSKKGWFTWGKEPVFNDKAIEEHANFVVKNLPKEPVLTSGSKGLSKFDLAKEYVAGSDENSKLELAKINADRAKLLLTPEERRNAKANQWLEREGILGKSSSESEVATSVDLSKYKDFNIDRYANKAIGIESSGNSKAQSTGGGSYYGLGQLNKESVEAMGINWNDYKNNPDTQVTAFKNFTAKNVKDLEANGIPVNDFTVYIAHNQGVGGAKQILSGETPSKQVMLNMLNQGIDNTLPKIPQGKPGAGQIDIKKVMADKTITADFLNKEYAPVDNYLRKFSKKFDTEIDKVITPGSTRLEVKGRGNEGYGITPNRLDKNKENASAYMDMTPDQRKELADSFDAKSGKSVEEVDALRSKLLNESDAKGSSQATKNLFGEKEFSKDFVYNSIGAENDPYAKVVADRYLNNNGGFVDSRTDITAIAKEKGISRSEAQKYYENITGKIKSYRDSLNPRLKPGYSETEEYVTGNSNVPTAEDFKKYGAAGLGTINSIAADAINVAASPYNTLRHGFDYITGRPFTKGYTENAATNAENTAIDRLSKVTDYPEEALIGASILSPSISGKARAFSGNGIKSLRNMISPSSTPLRVESVADDVASQENTSIINKFGLTANKKAKVNTDGDLKESINSRLNKNLQVQDITDKNTAQMFWNGVADAYAKGQIPKEKVMEKMQELNDSRFIGTKDLMLTLDGAVSKVSQELGNDVSKLRSELSELNNRKPGRPSAEYIKQTNELMDKLEKAIVKKEKYDLSNKSK